MKNWSPSAKIHVGFSAMFVCLILITAFAFYEAVQIQRVFDGFKLSVEEARFANEEADHVASIRLNELAYRTNPNPATARAIASEVNTLLEVAQEYRTGHDQAAVDEGTEAITSYDAAFKDYVEQNAKLERARDAMTDVTGELRITISEVMGLAFFDSAWEVAYRASVVQRDLLMASASAQRFLLTSDPEVIAEAAEYLHAAEEGLEVLDLSVEEDRRIELVETAMEQLEAFSNALASLEPALTARNRIVETRIETLGPALRSHFMANAEHAAEEQDRLGAEGIARVQLEVTVLPIVGLIIAILAGATAVIISRSIISSLCDLVFATERLAGGDLNVDLPDTGKEHAIGRLSTALCIFRDEEAARRAEAQRNTAKRLQEESQAMAALSNALKMLASGNLVQRVPELSGGAYIEVRDDFNLALSRLHDTVDGVLGEAEHVHAGSNRVSAANRDLHNRSSGLAATIEEVAAALEQMTESVRSTASAAHEATEFMSRTRESAAQSQEVMSRTLEAMTNINQSAEQITTIISTIDDIAFQTNLLALNAGVEAARAGAAGSGFAVVASEVRALALRAAEAAREIGGLIDGTRTHIRSGVELANEVGATIENIAEQVTGAGDRIERIATASNEQSSGLISLNSSLQEIDQANQATVAMIEETASASEELDHNAASLTQLSAQFQLQERTSYSAPRAA